MNHQVNATDISVCNANVRLLSRGEVSRHIDCLIETLPEFPRKEEVLESYQWIGALVRGEVADIIDFDDMQQIQHHFLWDAADLGYWKHGIRSDKDFKNDPEVLAYLSRLAHQLSERVELPSGE